MTKPDNPSAVPTPPPPPRKRARKWIVRLAVVAVVLAIVLIGTPYAIGYGIQYGLEKAGVKTVSLEDVDFNPFIGELVIKNLKSTTGSEPELMLPKLLIEVDWLPLFSKQIMVRNLDLQGATLIVEQNEQKQIRVAGILLPEKQEQTPEQPPSTWGFGVAQLALMGNTVVFISPDFTTHSELSNVSLQHLISWSPDQAAAFSFNTTLNQAPFSGDIKLNLFEETPRIEGAIKIDQLNLADFARLGGEAIESLSGKASVDIQFQLNLAESGISYQQNGFIRLQDTQLQTAGVSLSEPELRYEGNLAFSQKDAQQNLRTDGKLSSRQLGLSLPSPELTIAVGNTVWNGQFNYQSQPEAPSLIAKGGLQTGAINIRKTDSKFESLHLDTLKIPDLNLQELGDIKASGMQVDKLRVATPDPKLASLLAVEQINIRQPAFLNQNQIRLESIELKGSRSEVQVAKAGDLLLLKQLIASFESDKAAKEQAKDSASSTPMQVYVGGVDLGNDSQINLVIETNDKPIRKTLAIKKATIGALDSASPHAKTPIFIDAIIDKHATLTSKGHSQPFTRQLNLDLKMTITALDLHDLSPLIRAQIGYNINSGQLNANSDLKIVNDQIDGKNNLTINHLQVESAKLAATEKLDQQLAMPLDSALDLLRDGNGDIKLEVPLTGDINAPNFELGDIINQAIGGAVKGTTTNFLKLALQPYGLIFMAAEKALEASASISLEPVVFSPGSVALEGTATDYLQKLGQLMVQRPGIRIRICGIATASDRAVLEQAAAQKSKESKDAKPDQSQATEFSPDPLIQWATDRAHLIKSYLIENAGISADRLFTCLPRVAEEAEVQPKVELLI